MCCIDTRLIHHITHSLLAYSCVTHFTYTLYIPHIKIILYVRTERTIKFKRVKGFSKYHKSAAFSPFNRMTYKGYTNGDVKPVFLFIYFSVHLEISVICRRGGRLIWKAGKAEKRQNDALIFAFESRHHYVTSSERTKTLSTSILMFHLSWRQYFKMFTFYGR